MRDMNRCPRVGTTRLQDMPYFIAVGDALTRISLGDADESVSLRPRLLETDRSLPEIMSLVRTGRV